MKNFILIISNWLNHFGLLLILLLAFQFSFSQVNPNYTLNGSASQDDCHCYTLTPYTGSLTASVWNINNIDLTNSFDYSFDVFLGNSGYGADGIAFGLQNVSTNTGGAGSGMGLAGVSPSLGVYLDTYYNSTDIDPINQNDHISINVNGDVNHSSSNNLAGPIDASSTSPDIEDAQWHVLRIKWTYNSPTSQTIETYFDGVYRVAYTGNMINSIFSGNPNVFWGFTASTGFYKNVQKFCTALHADFATDITTDFGCAGIPVVFADSSVSFGSIVNWEWNFGDGSPVVSTGNTVSHTYSADGTYNAQLTITDNSGCTDSIIIPVSIVSPSVTATADLYTICPGDPVQLNVTANEPPCEYTLNMSTNQNTYGWSGAYLDVLVNGISIGNFSLTNGGYSEVHSFYVSSGDNIELIYTSGTYNYLNSYNFSDASGNIIFTEGLSPSTGSVFITTASCPSVTYDYSWNPDGGTLNDSTLVNPLANPISSIIYTVTVTDPSNTFCQASDTVGITVSPCSPCITDAGTMNLTPLVLCENDQTITIHNNDSTLDADDNFIFVLHDNSGVTLGTVLATNTTGVFNFTSAALNFGTTYYISAVAGNDDLVGGVDLTDPCLDVSVGTPVTWNENPTLDISGTTTICSGSNTNLTFSFTGTGPFNIVYTDGSSNFNLNNITNPYLLNVSPIVNTTYSLVSITDALTNCTGSVSSNTAIITIGTIPNAGSSNSVSICETENNLDLFTLLGGANIGGTWSDDNNAGGLINGIFDATGVQGGTYNFTYTISGSGACPSAFATITVTVNQQLSAGMGGNISVCTNGSVNLFSVLNGTPSINGFWNDDDNTGKLSNGIFNTSSIPTGVYNFTYTTSTTPPCVSSSTIVTVTVNPLPSPLFLANSVCEGLATQFTDLSTPAGNLSYSWSFDDGFTDNNPNPAHIYASSGNYNPTLTVTDNNNCSNSITAQVIVNANPIALFSTDPNPTSMLNPTVNFTDLSTSNIQSWLWDFSGLGSSNSQNTSYSFPSSGEYIVTLFISDINGCTDTTNVVVVVNSEFNIYIPNAFTPDGNSRNDVFIPKSSTNINEEGYSFSIYNRWGELMFESSSSEIGWNGTFKGELVSSGVYVWRLSFKNFDNTIYKRVGHVTLIY